MMKHELEKKHEALELDMDANIGSMENLMQQMLETGIKKHLMEELIENYKESIELNKEFEKVEKAIEQDKINWIKSQEFVRSL